MFDVHRTHEGVEVHAVEQAIVARDQRAVDRRQCIGDLRCRDQWILGHDPDLHRLVTPTPPSLEVAPDIADRLGIDSVDHDGEHRGVGVSQLVDGQLDQMLDVVEVSSLAADHGHDRYPEIGGDLAVDTQLDRARHLAVVRADDHDRVALVGKVVVTLDDCRHRGIDVLVHVVVGGPDGGGERRVGPVGQQVEKVVGPVAVDDRPEHAHATDSASHGVDQAEGNQRLAAATLGSRDEQRVRR